MDDFQHDASFQATEATGHFELDRYEALYQQLFSEALEDGIITQAERDRLEAAASELGIDPERLKAVEEALRRAYEAHHGTSVLDTSRMFAPRTLVAPPPDFVATVSPPPIPALELPSDEVQALRARVAYLEERVQTLEAELDDARSQIAYDVDFSDLDAPVPSVALDAPEALHRRLRHDPRDVTTLHALYLAHGDDRDRQLCIAQALAFLGAAGDEQRELIAAHRTQGLIQPRAALDATGWRRLLCHPDDEALTSDILSVIVSAVLLAHSAALKGAGKLPALDPARRLDPQTSTVQAARCFGWAAQTLGMGAPPLYASPDDPGVCGMLPVVPPALGLGKGALSGRTPAELAFLAGQQLAYFRPERFLRLLVPGIVDLQDMFLAALLIGNRTLPLAASVRGRVEPIAKAIERLLEAAEIDRLRAAYQRFVEHGGIANLQRWAAAADLTAVRTGFLLAGDLAVARRMLELEGAPTVEAAMDDLIVFVTGERYAKLREHLGITIS